MLHQPTPRRRWSTPERACTSPVTTSNPYRLHVVSQLHATLTQRAHCSTQRCTRHSSTRLQSEQHHALPPRRQQRMVQRDRCTCRQCTMFHRSTITRRTLHKLVSALGQKVKAVHNQPPGLDQRRRIGLCSKGPHGARVRVEQAAFSAKCGRVPLDVLLQQLGSSNASCSTLSVNLRMCSSHQERSRARQDEARRCELHGQTWWSGRPPGQSQVP